MPLRLREERREGEVATEAYPKIRATVLDRHKRLYLGSIGRNLYAIYVTGSSSSTGFITIWRETRPCDPNQIMEECTYCQGPYHSPTKCPTIIKGAWSSPSQRQMLPIPIPPKPKEDVTSRYPDHPIKPLPKRASEPKP